MQWHDATAVQKRLLQQHHAAQQKVDCAPEVASYAFYAFCVACGYLSWGEHLRIVSFRHGSDTPTPVTCAFPDCRITAAHFEGRLPVWRLVDNRLAYIVSKQSAPHST